MPTKARGDNLLPPTRQPAVPRGAWADNKSDGLRVAQDDPEQKVFGQLPDETWFYPGHGKDSTLGVERPSLPEWRARGW